VLETLRPLRVRGLRPGHSDQLWDLASKALRKLDDGG
jgi:hypothetical protein